MKAALIVAALVGCGSTPPPKAEPAAPSREASSFVCASSSFGALSIESACTAVDARCDFAEGTCACGPSTYCGGIPPSPELKAELANPTWHCIAKRTDGCPDQAPSGACTEEGRACSYGSCCIQAVTCREHTWTAGQTSCPP